MSKVLLIDDDQIVRNVVSSGLNGFHGIEVVTAASSKIGLRLLESERPSAVILDVFIGEQNGLELFHKIKSIDSIVPIIFITGQTSSEIAIQAMHAGAFDYLPKPFSIDRIRNLTLSAVKARLLMDQPVALTVGDEVHRGDRFIGNSDAMIEVYKAIGRVAASNVTVLIQGESGSGKELVARALVHHSDRTGKPFVAVNCAAIPDQLLESELFGHERGAFTSADQRRIGRFEQCDGGTILLDEVGDMSPLVQAKILRVLQEQKFERLGGNEQIATNVRIIAASNRPLDEMVQSGKFRQDLLYRLSGFTITLAPLRDRRGDIPLLLNYFLGRAKSEMERPELNGMSPTALELLVNYDWPGNVRQLQSVVRHSLINTTGTVLGADNLPQFIREYSKVVSSNSVMNSNPTSVLGIESMIAKRFDGPEKLTGLKAEPKPGEDDFILFDFIDDRLSGGSINLNAEVNEQVERRVIARVLMATGGNQSKTAEILGISRGKLRDRILAYGIPMERPLSIGDS